ncbi:MAG: hypothetical protein V8S95_04140 [Odoribacter sp.]
MTDDRMIWEWLLKRGYFCVQTDENNEHWRERRHFNDKNNWGVKDVFLILASTVASTVASTKIVF